jgi:hypothetical protein
MTGWGRVPVLVGLGVSLAVGCGGRTSAFDGEYGYSGNSGAEGGAATAGAGTHPTGGQQNRAGSSPVAGTSYGATGNVAGFGTGGATVGGTFNGGASFGGYSFGGVSPGGGFYTGGYAGFVSGGFTSAGTTSIAGSGPLDCQTCVREQCAPQLNKCLLDFGCLSIFACITSNGCQPFDCYSPQYCKGVIDQFGGIAGPSMNELLQSFTCAFNAGCQCG